MKATLRRHWFTLALAIAIPLGIGLGLEGVESVRAAATAVPPWMITAVVLFMMAFTLDSSLLGQAIRSPRPVLLASAINLIVVPAIAVVASRWQLLPDFQVGFMIAASVPCTVAAASVWTRRALGNDAVSLLVTLLTNMACVVVTPLWLQLGSGSLVELDGGDMTLRLMRAVLIPGAAGQLLRAVPVARRFAARHKPRISVAAMSCVLLLIFGSSCDAGRQLAGDGPAPDVFAVVAVWMSCVLLHLVALALGVLLARVCGVSRFDQPAVAFASSQKTLPVGVMLAREVGASMAVPFAVFPMLMFHASQLVIDTGIAAGMRQRREQDPGHDHRET